MSLWTFGIFLLFIGISCCASVSNDDHGIKRLHPQSRNLDGLPHNVGTMLRRKRSTREADYYKKIQVRQDDISLKGNTNANEAEGEVVIKHSDLAGKSGILVVEGSSKTKGLLVFAVRPVTENSSKNKYLKMKIFDDPSLADNEKDYDGDDDDLSQDFDDLSEEVIDDDFEDFSNQNKHSGSIKIYKVLNQKQSDHLQVEDPKPNQMGKQNPTNNRLPNRGQIKILVLRELSNPSNVNSNKKPMTSPFVDSIIIKKDPKLSSKPKSLIVLSSSDSRRFPNEKFGLRKRLIGKGRNM